MQKDLQDFMSGPFIVRESFKKLLEFNVSEAAFSDTNFQFPVVLTKGVLKELVVAVIEGVLCEFKLITSDGRQ